MVVGSQRRQRLVKLGQAGVRLLQLEEPPDFAQAQFSFITPM
jgi:hypothetical protein